MNQYLIKVKYNINGYVFDALLSIAATSESAAISAAASYRSVVEVYGVTNCE
jgi:hypothetical protein